MDPTRCDDKRLTSDNKSPANQYDANTLPSYSDLAATDRPSNEDAQLLARLGYKQVRFGSAGSIAGSMDSSLTTNRNFDANSTNGRLSHMPSQSSVFLDHNQPHMVSHWASADQQPLYGHGWSAHACLVSLQLLVSAPNLRCHKQLTNDRQSPSWSLRILPRAVSISSRNMSCHPST